MKLLISINFDDDTKIKLHNHMRNLTEACEGGVYTKKDNIHLSLVYVGETTQIGAVVETILKGGHVKRILKAFVLSRI